MKHEKHGEVALVAAGQYTHPHATISVNAGPTLTRIRVVGGDGKQADFYFTPTGVFDGTGAMTDRQPTYDWGGPL